MPSEQFLKLMDDLKELHNRKSHDYAQDENPFSNFERAAIVASWFDDPVDKVFAVEFGMKLSRLSELRNNKKIPKNESVTDSLMDFTCYVGLWTAYVRTGLLVNVSISNDIYQCPFTEHGNLVNFNHEKFILHMIDAHNEKFDITTKRFYPSRIDINSCIVL